MIANHAEPNFALLRYLLGGYRPSKTDRLPLSACLIQGKVLDFPHSKGGVSSTTPRVPKHTLPCLPLTLSIENEKPVTAYS